MLRKCWVRVGVLRMDNKPICHILKIQSAGVPRMGINHIEISKKTKNYFYEKNKNKMGHRFVKIGNCKLKGENVHLIGVLEF